MALIKNIDVIEREIVRVHSPAECRGLIFRQGDDVYLQLDTYGAAGRQIPGKVSQSIQFDHTSAAELKRLIESAFPDLR